MSERNIYEPYPFSVNITRKYGRVIPGNLVALDDGGTEVVPFNVHGTLKVGSRAVVEYVGRKHFVGSAELWA